MIDTTGFEKLRFGGIERKRRGTAVVIAGDTCRIQFDKSDYKSIESFIGRTCSVMYSGNADTIVISFGNDRRLSATNRSISAKALSKVLRDVHGDDVRMVVYTSKWDVDEKGRKALVLRKGTVLNGVG